MTCWKPLKNFSLFNGFLLETVEELLIIQKRNILLEKEAAEVPQRDPVATEVLCNRFLLMERSFCADTRAGMARAHVV